MKRRAITSVFRLPGWARHTLSGHPPAPPGVDGFRDGDFLRDTRITLKPHPWLLVATALLLVPPSPSVAQLHLGLSIGGASTVAVLVEQRWERRGLEVQFGTWGFRDVSVSVTAKQYIGSRAVEPFVGVGLWGIVARGDAGRGLGLIARLPIGLGGTVRSRHNAALAVYLNRALALRRPDPQDRRPPRTTIIPLPEISYRWRTER